MSHIALQCRVPREDYERIRHHARRRRITIAAWMREQAMYGIECDDEAENERARPAPAPAKSPLDMEKQRAVHRGTTNTEER